MCFWVCIHVCGHEESDLRYVDASNRGGTKDIRLGCEDLRTCFEVCGWIQFAKV